MTTLSYESTPDFDKDFKRLCKRFRTLPEDLETLKRAAIELLHVHSIDNLSCLEIPGCCTDGKTSYKVKKFPCKSLKGKGVRSGLRLTYIFFHAENRVLLVEIYYKGDQENEDRSRLIREIS